MFWLVNLTKQMLIYLYLHITIKLDGLQLQMPILRVRQILNVDSITTYNNFKIIKSSFLHQTQQYKNILYQKASIFLMN